MEYDIKYENDIERVIGCIPKVEELKEKVILVTGASGLIGSAVSDILFYLNSKKNYNISIFLAGRNLDRIRSRFYIYKYGHDYKFCNLDGMSNEKIDIQADYIIHCAGYSNPKAYAQFPVETLLVNIYGLHTILECAKRNLCKRVLYVSSSEVYGSRDVENLYSEKDYGYVDILKPRSCYPNGKRAGETLCSAFTDEYGIDTVIVRPGHIYGPQITDGDDRAVAQFTRTAIAHEDIVMKSAGLQRRSYCYSLDCASAILAVLVNGKSQNAYNISNKDSIISIKGVAEEFAKISGRNILFKPPTESERKGYNPMSISALNSEKIESIGWKAQFDIHEGVKRTMESYGWNNEGCN